jgi:hypothetical protein
MNSFNFDAQQLLPELFERIPSFRETYLGFVQNWNPVLSKKDKEELEHIVQLHNLPRQNYDLPGMTIVFENLLVPHLVELSKQNSSKQLSNAMDWIEQLAINEHFEVRNLVAGSVCVPLLTTHSGSFNDILPFTGKETIALCKMVSTGYRLSEDVRKLLNL